MKFFRSPSLSFWLAVLVSLLGAALWIAYLPEAVFRFTSESGPIERLTEWAYLAAMGIMLLFGVSVLKRKTLLAVLVVLGYMAAREADLHKALFSISILKIKFWLSGAYPLTDKLIAAAVLLPVAWAVLYLLAFRTLSLIGGIRERMPHAISICMIVAVTVISKVLDRSLNALVELFGWQFPQWLWSLQASQEELLECLIPFLFIVALFQYRGYIRQRGMSFFPTTEKRRQQSVEIPHVSGHVIQFPDQVGPGSLLGPFPRFTVFCRRHPGCRWFLPAGGA